MTLAQAASGRRTTSAERSLRLLVVASVLVPAFIFAGSAFLSYRRHFADAQERLERSVEILYEHAGRVFETLDLVAGEVDLLLAGLGDDEIRAREAELHARIKAITAPLNQVQIVLVMNSRARPLVSSGVYPVNREIDYSGRDYVQALRDGSVATGGTTVSGVLRGLSTDNTTFLIAKRRGEAVADPMRAKVGSAFEGIIAVSTKPAYFLDHYQQIAKLDIDTVTLLRADGTLLARHPGGVDATTERAPQSSTIMRTIAAAPLRGAYETVSIVDDVRRLYVYRRLPGHPIYVTAGINYRTVVAAWRSSLASYLLFGVPATGGLVLLALTALTRTRREAVAVAQLAERTRELDQVWRANRDLFTVLDADGTVRSANPAWGEALGYAGDCVVGLRFDTLAHPEDFEPLARQFKRLQGGEIVYDLDIRMRGAGGSYHWYSWTCVPEGDRLYASGRNVTERRHLADQLHQAQKMEAVGQLTGGVAHDFNNLLTIIRSSVDFLRRPELPEARKARYLDAVSDTVNRAAKLTGQLLAFARRQALTPKVFEVGAQLRGLAELIDTVTGARVSVSTEIPERPCYVRADISQFETALVNMAVNARDAMAGEGALVLRLACGEPRMADAARPRPDGRLVAVSLSDTGMGIAPEIRDKIFEPFFTTKEVGKGTGLGLSQVFGFAKQSGGDVEVRSELGHGATFILYLPEVTAGERERADARPDEAIPALAEPGQHVLLVEDNVEVGRFSTQILQDLGYRIDWVTNAEEALVKLGDDGNGFQLVFSDVVMPGMGGIALAQDLKRRFPTLPVVLTSGYSQVLAEEDSHGFELLHKPYSADQLARVFRRVTRPGRPPDRRGATDRP